MLALITDLDLIRCYPKYFPEDLRPMNGDQIGVLTILRKADSRKCGSVMDIARSLYLNNLWKVLLFLAHTVHFCITLLDWTS